MARDGIPSAVVGDALRRLEEELWYLRVEGGLYWFSSQPNLNRVIVEKEEAVHDDHLAEELRTRVEKVAGSELRVTRWPKASQDVPDTRDLKLAILSWEYTRQGGGTNAFVDELLKKCGTPFRTYQNTLLVLAPDAGEFAALRQPVKRFLALKAIRDDKALVRQLSEETRKTLEGKLKDTEGGLPFRTLSVYRHLAKAGERGVEWLDLGLPTVGEKASLAKRVREYLKGQELLLDRISPRQVLQKTLREDEQEKLLGDLLDAFLKYPHLPILESEDVGRKAIVQGVREGTFGVKVGERVYFNEPVPESALEVEMMLVRKPEVPPPSPPPPGRLTPEALLSLLGNVSELPVRDAYQQLWDRQKKEFESKRKFEEEFQRALYEGRERGLFSLDPPIAAEGLNWPLIYEQGKVKKIALPPPKPPTSMRTYTLRAKVAWDKLSDFVRGVVLPLRNDGADIQVEVLVQASSESRNIKPSTLEQKVKETLNQIGAQILEDSQE